MHDSRGSTIQRSGILISGIALMILALGPSSARAQGLTGASVELSDPAASSIPDSIPDVESERVARVADEALVARMEEQLVQRASGENTFAVVTGITSLALGAALIGSAIWLSVDDGAFGGGFGTPNPAAITGLALAPMLLAAGIYSLVATRPNGDRLTRWRAAMRGELSPVELGRFEGELRAEANTARVSRWGAFAIGLGLAVGGGITVVYGAAVDGFDDEFRGIVIGTGGGFVVLGAVMMGTSFLETSLEQMWDQYQRGDDSEPSGLSVRVLVGPGGVGLAGSF